MSIWPQHEKHPWRMKWHILLCGALALTIQNGAQACEESGVALRYLAAIDDMDWHTMSSLLAGDARYTDPTMVHYDRPAIDLVGRDAIVGFWRSSAEDSGTSDISYTVTGCFETAGYHVVNLDIAIRVAGEFWNVDQEEILVPGKVMSVIRVREGAVIEHHDYVSYAGADAVIDELRQRYGTLEAERP